MSDKNIFWLNDPTVLYKNGTYKNILPLNTMTRVEQMNALTRLFIYLLIIILLLIVMGLYAVGWIIILPIIAIVFIIILYKYQYKGSKAKEIFSQKEERHDFLNNKINEQVNYDQLHTNNSDRQSDTINLLPAYNCDDDDIISSNDLVNNNNLDQDLHKNFDDSFNTKNVERIWCTGPDHSIPDQSTFANWLYNNGETCKEDNTKCVNNYAGNKLRKFGFSSSS